MQFFIDFVAQYGVWLALALAIASSLLFALMSYISGSKIQIFFKTFASLSFTLLGICVFIVSDFLVLGVILIIRLCFGLLGDVFIACHELFPPLDMASANDYKRSDTMILIGLLAFSVEHILFVAFTASGWLPLLLTFVGGLVFAVVAMFLMKKMGLLLRSLNLAVIFYSLLMGMIIVASITTFFTANNISYSVILTIASILFAISDLLLSQMFFTKCANSLSSESYNGHILTLPPLMRPVKAVNLMTYYASQILFCLALL